MIPAGQERLRISRLAMNVVGGGTGYSRDPKFLQPRPGKEFNPVYFRYESEPYYVASGVRISYNPNYPPIFHRVAVYVEKILKGACATKAERKERC